MTEILHTISIVTLCLNLILIPVIIYNHKKDGNRSALNGWIIALIYLILYAIEIVK